MGDINTTTGMRRAVKGSLQEWKKVTECAKLFFLP
jgi:hypothetical protein